MADSNEALDTQRVDEAPVEHPPAPPIESRFLFVDVAAMRAKQLRRGARPRLKDEHLAAEKLRAVPHKPERVAMEEVRHGLVYYEVPDHSPATN